MTLFANEQHDGALTLIAGEKKIQFESFHNVSKWQSHSELVNNLMANTDSFTNCQHMPSEGYKNRRLIVDMYETF